MEWNGIAKHMHTLSLELPRVPFNPNPVVLAATARNDSIDGSPSDFGYVGIVGLNGDRAGLRPIFALSIAAPAAAMQSQSIPGVGYATQLLPEVQRWIG